MNFRITKESDNKAKKHIGDRLYKFNLKNLQEDLRGRYEEIELYVRDEQDIVHGGITGAVCWNWLEIHDLFLEEDIRGVGYGTKLLSEIEKIALEKNCDFVKLDTLSFQALDFYIKHGYSTFGILENVGREHTHYYLKKDLNRRVN